MCFDQAIEMYLMTYCQIVIISKNIVEGMEQELIETVKIEYSVEKEIQSMIDLFSIQSYSRAEAPMIKYIKSQLKGIKKLQYKQDNYGNILVTKGSIIW